MYFNIKLNTKWVDLSTNLLKKKLFWCYTNIIQMRQNNFSLAIHKSYKTYQSWSLFGPLESIYFVARVSFNIDHSRRHPLIITIPPF